MHDKKDEYVFDGQQTLKRLNAINLNQYHPSTCITETLNDFKPYTQNASIYASEIFEINIAHHARNHHNSSVKSKTIAHIQKQGVEPDYERTKQQGMDRFIRMVKKANKIGLKLNPYKTTVYAETVAFTGFQVSSDGLIPLPRNRTKILSFPYSRLQYKSDWQAFEGGILFLNEYIIDLAEDLNHLRALLISKAESEKIKAQHPTWSIKQRNRRTRLRHSNESRAVFKQLLDKVSSIPILHHPDLCADGGCFVVKTDASMHGAGSSLWQMRGDSLVLIKLAELDSLRLYQGPPAGPPTTTPTPSSHIRTSKNISYEYTLKK
eukprot:956579_1